MEEIRHARVQAPVKRSRGDKAIDKWRKVKTKRSVVK